MYRMILDTTLPDVIAAETRTAEDARAADADASAARTRADYGRVSRWALGILGTAGALVGSVVCAIAIGMVTDAGTNAEGIVFGIGAIVVAAAIAVPSVWLLIALHRSGRRLARAAGYWAGLPYRQGRRSPTKRDWFAVRFLGFSSDLFLRLVTSALAALATIFAITLLVRAVVTGEEIWQLVLWITWSAVFASVCAGQFGGVQRIQNGHLARDPAPLLPRR